MIEATATTEFLEDSDTYRISVEVSALTLKLAAANGSDRLAQFISECMQAEVERIVNGYNA